MSKKFKLVKDESLLTTPLKKNIKWTQKKIIMSAIVILIPYSAFVFYLISSGLPKGAMVSMILVPLVMLIAYSIIYSLTRNL